MKKNIAHVYETYLTGDLNGLRCFSLINHGFNMIALCEKTVAKPEEEENVRSLSDIDNRFVGAILPFINNRLSRSIYTRFRDVFYRRILTENKVALIHAHFGSVGASVSDLAKDLGIPMVVTFYGMDVSRLIKKRRWVKSYRKMFKINGRFIVLCEEAKRRLEAIGCPEEKIRIADCLNDLGPYTYKERKPGKGVKLLIAARFVEKKGYPILLEAMSQLVKGGSDVVLTIMGYGSAKEKEALTKKIKEKGLCDRVTVIETSGRNVDFAKLFKEKLDSHDIFVLPSITAKDGDDEGGPSLSLVCAQAAGMPVITTPFPGSEKSVIDNKTGLYCRENDPASLSEKIAYLIDNQYLWNVLGRNASNFVNENLSLEKELDKIVKIYKELL